MKILVTGGTGFIGRHLVEKLSKENHEIWCIVRENKNKEVIKKLQNQGVKILFGDLKNIKTIELPSAIDWVFHLAALVDTTDIYSFDTLFQANVKPTYELSSFYLGKIRKFIFLSSMAAIGISNKRQFITEKDVCKPTSSYGLSKLKAEEYLLKLHQERQFPIVILRPPTVYGPGEHYNFLKLARAIFQKKFWVIGAGKNKMSLCFVENLVDAMVLAAKSNKGIGETFLVDDGRPYSLNEIVHEIAKAEGKRLSSFSIPLPVAYMVGVFFEFLAKILPIELPLSRKRITTLTANFAFDITKIKNTLRYSPKIPFSKAVVQTINAFNKEKLLTK